ncbi:hypothetical protein ON010_g13021 [Phytophthora cinnamomi]|nr:hypothetical protein ON010_g13021 [Phytophthora cinnamomi]
MITNLPTRTTSAVALEEALTKTGVPYRGQVAAQLAVLSLLLPVRVGPQLVDKNIQQSHQFLLWHPLRKLRVAPERAERVVADVSVVVRGAAPHQRRVLGHVHIALHAQKGLPHAPAQRAQAGRRALVARQAVHDHEPLELAPALVVGGDGRGTAV